MGAVLGALWGAGGFWQNHLKTWNPFFKKRNFERIVLTWTKARRSASDGGKQLVSDQDVLIFQEEFTDGSWGAPYANPWLRESVCGGKGKGGGRLKLWSSASSPVFSALADEAVISVGATNGSLSSLLPAQQENHCCRDLGMDRHGRGRSCWACGLAPTPHGRRRCQQIYGED